MDELANTITSAKLHYILLGVLCMIVFYVCESFNMRRTLRALGEKCNMLLAVKYTLIGAFFSAITPAASGGQPMQIFFMHRDGIKVSSSTISLLLNLMSFQTITIVLELVSACFLHEYMDAGVKIKKPVSGIAMGMISDSKTGKYAILSDILGDEDHLGDMDFKVCGTADGITACQMDIKVEGLSYEVLAEALEQARKGRLFILNKLTETIAQPREDYKPFVPRIVQITIPKDFIGAVIGPGGKVIQDIQKTTNTVITITEDNEVGIVDISSADKDSINAALERIKAITAVPEIGEIYKGTVKSIITFGAFIEILPGKEGLLHISEIDHKRVNKVEDVLHEGEQIEVKLIDIDEKTGKLKLSRKVLLPKPEKQENDKKTFKKHKHNHTNNESEPNENAVTEE